MGRKAKAVDWDAIEIEYRAGLSTLRQIGERFGVSHVAIGKKAKTENWSRDLSAKIAAAVEEKVTKAAVTKEVTKTNLVTEKAIIQANAESIADRVLSQRSDVARARSIVTALFEEMEFQIGENLDDLKRLGDVLSSEDDDKQDVLVGILQKVISLPGRTDTVKKLSESLRILVELERKVLKIKDEPDQVPVAAKVDNSLSGADAYLLMLGKK